MLRFLGNREMHIKTPVRYHFTSSRCAKMHQRKKEEEEEEEERKKNGSSPPLLGELRMAWPVGKALWH